MWHWDPQATFGPWNGRWCWPVDALYPTIGAALGLAAAAVAVLYRRRRGNEG